MTTAGYLNSGNRIEEGKHYLFKVVGQVVLQDERTYFILEDPYRIRHLLPSWDYRYYGIKTGQSISCNVDKINCTGRVYLEPEHPYYKEDNLYEFDIVKVVINEQIHTIDKASLIVKDIFENEISIIYSDSHLLENPMIVTPVKVTCKLVHIRKGLPVLILCKGGRIVS